MGITTVDEARLILDNNNIVSRIKKPTTIGLSSEDRLITWTWVITKVNSNSKGTPTIFLSLDQTPTERQLVREMIWIYPEGFELARLFTAYGYPNFMNAYVERGTVHNPSVHGVISLVYKDIGFMVDLYVSEDNYTQKITDQNIAHTIRTFDPALAKSTFSNSGKTKLIAWSANLSFREYLDLIATP